MDRVILHCDCNSFFASVESVLDPSLKNVPMAVSGSTDDRHGIILAKNEMAKAYGIVTAETVYSAKRKCPSLITVHPHYEEYTRFSRAVNAIYAEYTDLVEPFGIDESWLDVTASRRLFGSGEDIASEIRRRVREELGITVSVGVSFNKVFAKLGSDYKKPDASTVISRENFKEIVYPLPASDLLFVGKETALVLKTLGIRTIGELAEFDEETLIKKLGKMGRMLSLYARGLDESPVVPPSQAEPIKSISSGHTFKRDLLSKEECKKGIYPLAEEIGMRLRASGLRCSTVSITVKDSSFVSVGRQRGISPSSDIGSEIAEVAYSLLLECYRPGNPIRSITVGVSGLLDADLEMEQLDIFGSTNDEARVKSRKKEQTVDLIRNRFGSDAIVSGFSLEDEL